MFSYRRKEFGKKFRHLAIMLPLPSMIVWFVLSFINTPLLVGTLPADATCNANQYKCKDGSCILREKMCDGRYDCLDNSDELDCDFKMCRKPNWFQCAQPHGPCLSSELICNGIENCPFGDDELDCVGRVQQTSVGGSFDIGTGGWHGTKRNCSVYEFTCESDKSCIPLNFMCNGERDCYDGSDETTGCLKAEASCPGHICANRKCLESKKWVCDGVDDCGDGSDERNCVTNCTLEFNSFLCADNKTCLSLSQVCNGKSDCTDGSDESQLCTAPNLSCISKHCPPASRCYMLPNLGPVCLCPNGFRHSELLDTCQDIDECLERYDVCSQNCENTSGSYKCSCDTGYLLDAKDNRTCYANDANLEPMLLYSTQVAVMGIHLNSKRVFSIARNLTKVIGVAYNGEHIYWTNIKNEEESIVRANTDGTDQEILLTSGLDAPEDLAVDWLTDNIYFSDNVMRHIAVCSNDGVNCVVLVTIDVHHPRGIALWPQRGQMFWTDWGEKPMIARASMDGMNSLPIVSDNIQWPNGIALDLHNNRLYWVDAKIGTMESVRPDGTGRRMVLNEVLKHPYGVAVFEDKIFWSDWGTKSIHECNKFTGKNHKILVKDRTIYAVHVYHPAKQPKVAHACHTARCTHLCLLAENNSFSCACPDGMQLSHDQRRCVRIQKKKKIFIGIRNTLLAIEHTPFGRHTISETHQLPYYISEMVYNSVNGSIIIADNIQRVIAEFDPVSKKIEILTHSNLGNITDLAFDHMSQNVYWSDSERHVVEVLSLHTRSRAVVSFFSGVEAPIGLAIVPSYGFMFVALRSRRHTHIDQLPLNGRGDHVHVFEDEIGDDDINFAIDYETHTLYWTDSDIGRISFTDYRKLHAYTFRGRLRRPYSIALVDNDIFWSELRSSSMYWTHKGNMGPMKRIQISVTRDSYAHALPAQIPIISNAPTSATDHPCQHNNAGCSHICLTKSKFESDCICPAGFVFRDATNRTCIEALDCEFRCRSGECLTMSHRCNGRKDCPDESDEEGCDIANEKKRPKVICAFGEFMCHDADHCIENEKRCDGHRDCHDDSDEKHCEQFDKAKLCHRHQHPCDNGKCIDLSVMCDGIDDCGDNSDEVKCMWMLDKISKNGPSCGKDMFQCNTGTCIASSWECDGKIDCVDSSDEHEKCGFKDCAKGMHRCLLGQCIDGRLVCDGHNDCGDQSDELHCDSKTSTNLPFNISCGDDVVPMFQCKSNSSVCLPMLAKCNGTAECPRGEDESNCGEICSIYEFQCKESKKCIRQEFRCDHEKDCADGSDEIDCTQATNMTVGTKSSERACKPHMFDCQDGECVDMSRVCNGFPDCENGIDEGTQCMTACKSTSGRTICEHKCRATPTGAVCSCFDGYKLDADLRSCIDINECLESEPCAQICENSRGSYHCQCYPDFMLRQDRSTCKSIDGESTLLFTTYNEVRSMSDHPITLRVAWSANDSKIAGFDVNVRKRNAYFSNENEDILYMVNMDSGIIKAGLLVQAPSKVSVDWITENVYAISRAQSYEIVVCSFSVKMCSRIIKSKPSVTIKALTVDAFNRHLFYVSLHSISFGQIYSQITIAQLDGNKREMLYRKFGGYISALAIDAYKRMLYYVDMHTKTLEAISYKPYVGGNRKPRILIQKSNAILHPSGLSVYENHAYIVNIGAKEAVRCQLYAAHTCKAFNLNILNAEDISINGSSRQPLSRNPCTLAKCSGLCVQSEYGYECMCGDNIVTENDYCDRSHSNEMHYGALLASNPNTSDGDNSKNSANSVAHAITVVVSLSLLLLTLIGAIVGYMYYRRIKRGHRDHNINLHFQNPLATLNKTQHQATALAYAASAYESASGGGSGNASEGDDASNDTGTTAASFTAGECITNARDSSHQFGLSSIRRLLRNSQNDSMGTEILLETTMHRNEVSGVAATTCVPSVIVEDECCLDTAGYYSGTYVSDDVNAKLVP